MKPKPVLVVFLILFLIVLGEGFLFLYQTTKKSSLNSPQDFQTEKNQPVSEERKSISGKILVYDPAQIKLTLETEKGVLDLKINPKFKFGFGRGVKIVSQNQDFSGKKALVYYFEKSFGLEAISAVIQSN